MFVQDPVINSEQARVEKEELEVEDTEQDDQEAVTNKEMAGLIHEASIKC